MVQKQAPASGFTLIEVATSLIILAVLAAMLVPLATNLLDSQRATTAEADLNKVYTAIVGDPKQNNYGYLGDVGAYPSSLMDLVQSPGVAGWNGPYLSGVSVDTSTGTSQIYDAFGSPVEYYSYYSATFPSAAIDQIALASRGPDRGSSDIASNPNSSQGIPPSSFLSSNADNVYVPHIVDNANLAYYQSLGKLNINILNSDDNAAFNAVVPGCPNYFDVTITSIPRGTVEAWVNYAPGGASFDLVQGLYRFTVYVAGTQTPVWQEQVAIVPGNTVTRSVTLPGVNSSLTSTLTLTTNNTMATGNILQFYLGGTSLGTNSPASAQPINMTTSPNRCARILVRNTLSTVNTIIDSFIMPNPQTTGNNPPVLGSTAITRRYYATNSICSWNFANQTYNTIAIYEDQILIGTVGKRGNMRKKSFLVRAGDTLTFKDETNTARTAGSFSNPVSCASPGTGTF